MLPFKCNCGQSIIITEPIKKAKKMTLREIMTEQIKRQCWLDFSFIKTNVEFDRQNETWTEFNERAIEATKSNDSRYLAYLNSLNDEDFLDAYNRIRQAENNLD